MSAIEIYRQPTYKKLSDEPNSAQIIEYDFPPKRISVGCGPYRGRHSLWRQSSSGDLISRRHRLIIPARWVGTRCTFPSNPELSLALRSAASSLQNRSAFLRLRRSRGWNLRPRRMTRTLASTLANCNASCRQLISIGSGGQESVSIGADSTRASKT